MKDIIPRKYRLLTHLIFWLCVMGLFLFTSAVKGGDLRSTLILNLLLLPFDMGGAYFTIYILLPIFLFRGKYYLFFIVFLLFTLIYGVLIIIPAEYFLVTNYYEADKWGDVFTYLQARLLWTLTILLMINGLAASVKITKHWLLIQRQAHEIEKEKIETELKLKEAEIKFLKSQIHPHFLFNTLNNLYGLTLQKSEDAPEVVVKLSEMLDYMLYEGNQSLVPLDDEIRLVENYIGLEKIRHDEHLSVELKVRGENKNLYIGPLLLLAFIENAFKHGASKQSGTKNIRAEIDLRDKTMLYRVTNSFEKNADTDINDIQERIGIENLRKRLELQYKDKHSLKFDIVNNNFIALMEVELSSEKI